MTTIKFSDVHDISELQAVEIQIEESVEETPPNESIPSIWRQMLSEDGADVDGIEWWEAPNFLNTMGKQGFARPMIPLSIFILGIPFLCCLAFPSSLLEVGATIDEFLLAAIFASLLFVMGILIFILCFLYISYLSATCFSVGGLGSYFYAATSRSFIIAYRPFPIPFLSKNNPPSVNIIPFQGKYFRGDLRLDGSGCILLPSSNMTVDQKRDSLGGKAGFLYVKKMEKLLNLIENLSTGPSSHAPIEVPYAKKYAALYALCSILFGVTTAIIFIVSLLVSPSSFFVPLITFISFKIFVCTITGYYAFYWYKHGGIIHINSPPNPAQHPEMFPLLMLAKLKRNV